MKRFIALLLLAVTLTFSLASCNKPEYKWKYVSTGIDDLVLERYFMAHNIDDFSITAPGCYEIILIYYDIETTKTSATTRTDTYKVDRVAPGVLYVFHSTNGETYAKLEYFDSYGEKKTISIDKEDLNTLNTLKSTEWASVVSNDPSDVPEDWRIYSHYDKTEILKYLTN